MSDDYSKALGRCLSRDSRLQARPNVQHAVSVLPERVPKELIERYRTQGDLVFAVFALHAGSPVRSPAPSRRTALSRRICFRRLSTLQFRQMNSPRHRVLNELVQRELHQPVVYCDCVRDAAGLDEHAFRAVLDQLIAEQKVSLVGDNKVIVTPNSIVTVQPEGRAEIAAVRRR